ncbi:MAG: hypothetical protein ACSHYF_01645 [Verrucomicrobiaceae bacterium]
MKELLELGLTLAGLNLVILTVASFWIPKALEWKRKLAVLSPLMKQMWWTYALYVFASHVFFAVLALTQQEWLLSGHRSAAVVTGFITLWWGWRLGLQFFSFNLDEVKPTRGNELAKHLLTLLFVSLVTAFGAVLCWNLGWLGERGLG